MWKIRVMKAVLKKKKNYYKKCQEKKKNVDMEKNDEINSKLKSEMY